MVIRHCTIVHTHGYTYVLYLFSSHLSLRLLILLYTVRVLHTHTQKLDSVYVIYHYLRGRCHYVTIYGYTSHSLH